MKYIRRFLRKLNYVIPILFILSCVIAYVVIIYKNSHFKPHNTAFVDAKDKPVAMREVNLEEELIADSMTDKPAFQLTILDVGNASCALIESNGECMLFDGGDRDTSSYVVSYLKSRNIKQIKYMVASHYHADHVYGLIGVYKNFNVQEVLAPDYISSNGVYNAFLKTVPKTQIVHPYVDQIFTVGGIQLRTIAPVDDAYSDDNGYSIGFVGDYNNFRFLIDGDATDESESDMLKANIDLASDLLIVPHHGSTYSSSEDWLKEVSPTVAIISCGENNSYFHPHEKVLTRLKEVGVSNLFRTDLNGVIKITSDGTHFSVETEKVADEEMLWLPGQGDGSNTSINSDVFQTSSDVVEDSYIGNTISKKFHRPSCELVPSEEKQMLFSSREGALVEGYIPCGVCDP